MDNTAAVLALQSKQFVDYEDLLSKGLTRLDEKVYYEIIRSFDEESKDKLNKIHRKFVTDPSEKHLISLIAKSKIYIEGQQSVNRKLSEQPFYTSLITRAYEELNSIPEIRVCLQFVSHFPNLNISFDINKESVLYLDSRASPYVRGRTSTECLIAAKGFDRSREEEYFKILGVLAHELYHFAILFKYNNDYKPYFNNDVASKEKLEEAYEAAFGKRWPKDDIINSALNVDEDIIHDELIVCVPHILAQYKDNDEKIQEFRQRFFELFDFFDKKTLPDLKVEIELLTAVSELKEKKSQSLSLEIFLKEGRIEFEPEADKVLKILSNCPQLTMHSIYQQILKIPRLQVSPIFLDLGSAMKDNATFDLVKKAFRACTEPTIIFNCDNEKSTEVEKFVKKMKNNDISSRMVLVHNFSKFLIQGADQKEVSHFWEQLNDASKEKLMKRNVKFQGEDMLLEEIVELSSEALNKISLNLLLNNSLEIGETFALSENEDYIERIFSNGNLEIEASQLLENAANEKTILLSGAPGMGKTTELKMLATGIKETYPSYWTAYIDLKKHFESYGKAEKLKTVFNNSDDVVKFFSDKILKLKSFEAEIFMELFRNNRVVLLMDGFDEISPTFNVFMTNLLQATKELSKNILFISTRPHHMRKLEDKLDLTAYTFCPLTDENCEKLLLQCLKEIEGEALDQALQRIKDFYLTMNSQEDMKNPMLLSMIAKVFTEDDKIAEAAKPNIFWVYENFVRIMIAESCDKGFDARNEIADATTKKYLIIDFYQKEAFKLLCNNRASIYANALEELFKGHQPPQEEHKTRASLMKSDGLGNYHFIHQTFAEFFVIQFILKNVFETLDKKYYKNQDVFQLLKSFCQDDEEDTIRNFFDGAFESFISNAEFINDSLYETFVDIYNDQEELGLNFQAWIETGRTNLVTVVTHSVQRDRKRLFGLWNVEQYVNLEYDVESNPFLNLAKCQTLNINEKLFKLVNDVFEEKDVKEHFVFDRKGFSILRHALRNSDPRVADFYSERIEKLYPSDRSLQIMKRSFYPLNALRKQLHSFNLKEFQKELDQIEKLYGVDYLKRLLVSPSLSSHNTIYFEACQTFKALADFEILWVMMGKIFGKNVLEEVFLKTNFEEITPLMLKTKHCKEVFLKFWELIEEPKPDLDERDKSSCNVFYHATQSIYPETFNAVKDLYMELFGKERVKTMLKTRIMVDNVLCFSAAGKNNFATFKLLWEFLQTIFDKDVLINFFLLQRYFYVQTNVYSVLRRNFDFKEKLAVFEEFIRNNMDDNQKRHFKHESTKEEWEEYKNSLPAEPVTSWRRADLPPQ